MKRSTFVLFAANIVCAAALSTGTLSPRLLFAQTGPQPVDCCKDTTEKTKFCCDNCCWTYDCKTTEECNKKEE